jgi:hypothetical protein
MTPLCTCSPLPLGAALHYLPHAHTAAGSGVDNALGSGLVAGVGAILTYQMIAGDVFGGSAPAPKGYE